MAAPWPWKSEEPRRPEQLQTTVGPVTKVSARCGAEETEPRLVGLELGGRWKRLAGHRRERRGREKGISGPAAHLPPPLPFADGIRIPPVSIAAVAVRYARGRSTPPESGLPLSPASRHGGEAIDHPKAPPPPPDAAAEQAQELQLPADIDWDRLDKSRFFVLGAGLFSAVSAALYPAVVLKTRLQVAPEPPPAHAAAAAGARAAGAGLPPSAAAAATTILRREGPLAFYRGFATSLAGTVPARALYMGALEATRSAVGPAMLSLGAPEPAASAVAGAAAGLTAAVAAQVVWTPVDVISQRLMVQGNPCPASRYHGGLDAFRKIVASDGLRGLYRGFGMSILTYAPSNAVWWATYSLSQKTIWSGIGRSLCQYGVGVQEIDDGDGDISLEPNYKTLMVVQGVSAATAGGAAAVVTMPLDTIKTRMQVMDGPITIGRTVRMLIKEGGWGACYRGLGPRWASMSLSATTMITTYEFLKRLSAKKGQETGAVP
ncbi:unnamed protein product [Alopecurus aequalis]